MVANLEGLRRLRLVLGFGYAGERVCTVTFAEPASQLSRVRAALVQQLSAVRWPASLEQIAWTVLETGELSAPQLTLFVDPPQQLLALDAAGRQLAERYGSCFFR
ncbi:MAG: hypothetical protein IPK16_23605 [Anaerolineales bacterium]|nr:hypothetical protein [Anaerolineales bacterium]